MSGVEIPGEDDFLAPGMMLVAQFKQAGIEAKFEGHALVLLPPIGEVNDIEEEIRILQAERAPFVIEFFHIQTGVYRERLMLEKCCRAAVARSLGGMPKALIFGVFAEQLGHLLRLGFDFLQTQDVGFDLIQPGETILIDDCSDPVDIPGCNSHVFAPFQSLW